MAFDLAPETCKRTTLGKVQRGDLVNLERALRVRSRIEGHIVQGHVEKTGTVVGYQVSGIKNPQSRNRRTSATVMVRVSKYLLRSIVPQGSIAMDGVSLTVAGIHGTVVTVALIPYTLRHTTLGTLQEGDRVNIETDVLLRNRRIVP